MIFDYPEYRSSRRHGPCGYQRYESYRPWLRDEFCFRCVYCLKREQWGVVTGEFDLDHFQPKSVVPELQLDYTNLVYSCHRCNLVKADHPVNDPFECLTSRTVISQLDGSIDSLDRETRRLILQLDLDSPKLRRWRYQWIRIVQLADEHDRELLLQLTGFSIELPNLRRLRPPNNTEPEGVEQSFYARQKNRRTSRNILKTSGKNRRFLETPDGNYCNLARKLFSPLTDKAIPAGLPLPHHSQAHRTSEAAGFNSEVWLRFG